VISVVVWLMTWSAPADVTRSEADHRQGGRVGERDAGGRRHQDVGGRDGVLRSRAVGDHRQEPDHGVAESEAGHTVPERVDGPATSIRGVWGSVTGNTSRR
jgi:hypothetical protein